MNEKIIKWCCHPANGFSIKIIDNNLCIDYIGFSVPLSTFDIWAFKPLFLQVVIEGIETQYSELGYTFRRQYKCSTYEWTMEIYLKGNQVYVSERYADIIKAKEAVVEWVYNKLLERGYC